MAVKITTKQLFDEYFKSLGIKAERANRATIDNAAFDDWQKRHGKSFVEMTPEDFVDYFTEIGVSTTQKNTISLYRRAYKYYIKHYDPSAYNPLSHDIVLNMKLKKDDALITDEYVEDVFKTIKEKYDKQQGAYLGCVVWLMISGMQGASQILTVKDSDVDYEDSSISFDGYKIHISEHTADLIRECDRLVGESFNNNSTFVRWRHSLLPVAVINSKVDNINERDEPSIKKNLTNYLRNTIKQDFPKLKWGRLRFYGFYKYLVGKYGEDFIYSNIMSEESRMSVDFSKLLRNEAFAFGLSRVNEPVNISSLRTNLKLFLFG